jgi:hypothetical protein
MNQTSGKIDIILRNHPINATDDAVIAAVICSVSLQLRSVLKEKYCVDRGAC